MGLVARLEEVDVKLFGDLGLYKCEPIKIQFDENAEPYCFKENCLPSHAKSKRRA